MNSIGVIYDWYNKLPRFDSVFTHSGVDPVKAVKILKDMGLTSDKNSGKQDLLETLELAEKKFGQDMSEIHQHGDFFYNLVWLSENMPKIRLRIRKSFLNEPDVNKTIDEVNNICSSNEVAAKMFRSYFSKNYSWKNKDLAILEGELDELFFKILKKASGFTRNSLRSYLSLLKKRAEYENSFRIKLRSTDEEDKQDHDKYFKDSFEEECRYVNQAVFDADTDLINLQCMVCYKYFFYNLRVNFSLKDSKKSDILVNYNLN